MCASRLHFNHVLKCFLLFIHTVADCGLLPGILNGDVTMSPDTEFGAVTNYSCDPGYVLRGTDTRNCDADEQWDNSEPFCMRKDTCIAHKK